MLFVRSQDGDPPIFFAFLTWVGHYLTKNIINKKVWKKSERGKFFGRERRQYGKKWARWDVRHLFCGDSAVAEEKDVRFVTLSNQLL